MTPERWQQVKEVLDNALSLDTTDRPAYLDQACLSDAELRSEVESLLLADDQAGTGFLNTPALNLKDLAQETIPLPSRVGHRIGAYSVLAEIGQGGMGEVYRAVRADGQYEKEVAVKLVRGGFNTTFVLERFRNERQILAGLDHPNIARLLDGGTTEDGIPYLVMEFVDGIPIDQYCDTHHLSISQRLEIFRQVCAAVQYAHQHLVIHRDIKPSNVLVTKEGVPKLLDFGIAKILDPSTNYETTLAGPMTPEYASPEQVRGESVTTATDVYSLGVVLYQLLTGRSPYRRNNPTQHELSRAITDVEPERPSAVVLLNEEFGRQGQSTQMTSESFSRSGEGSAAKLGRRLAGDLDNIVLKAMRKDPARRYASVEQFGEDIRRHREGLPVTARKDSWSYRTGKFVRRHKIGVAATALAVIMLIISVSLIIREARIAETNQKRAEHRFNDVRKLANSLMFDIHDSIQDLPGSTPARQLIVQDALQYLDSLANESSGDLSLQRELATAYEKVGDVQNRLGTSNLGDTTGALRSQQKALTIREAIVKAAPVDLEARADLANSYGKLGVIDIQMGNYTAAAVKLKRSLEIHQDLAAAAPQDKRLQFALAVSYDGLGDIYVEMKDLDSALLQNRQSLAIFESLATAEPQNRRYLRDASLEHKKIGGILEATGKLELALQQYQDCLQVDEALATEDPNDTMARRDVAITHTSLGDIMLNTGHMASALSQFQQAIDIDEALAKSDPKDASTRGYLIADYEKMGTALSKNRDFSGALAYYGKALKLAEFSASSDPGNVEARQRLANAYSGLGAVYFSMGSPPNRSLASRKAHLLTARGWYDKSFNIWAALKKDGTLGGRNSKALEVVSRAIAACNSAITELGKNENAAVTRLGH